MKFESEQKLTNLNSDDSEERSADDDLLIGLPHSLRDQIEKGGVPLGHEFACKTAFPQTLSLFLLYPLSSYAFNYS